MVRCRCLPSATRLPARCRWIPPLYLALALLALSLAGAQEPSADFLLADRQEATPFVVEPGTDRSVVRAANDVRTDIANVTGATPRLAPDLASVGGRRAVIVGVVGHSPLLAQLVAEGKLDAQPLVNAWESFTISVIAHPFPGLDQALVIAGSDRRGAIFGLYEISNQIGVSPWHWWADVTPEKRDSLTIAAGTRRFGPPSVKYRGIFLNDEDWGLQPWAARTFEPETGNIGSKTYAKIFELLLRLRANTVWPGMHPTTRAFNQHARNKEVADEYGIVMGSSHAEPMLRNNVSEWTAPHEDYNYLRNREGVLRYWEARVAENGRYENIYTLGMRGIHDSHMRGPRTDPERIALLEQIFADQRALLARHVRPEVEQVPQMFCAYKEVLGLYRQGLRVPDDVTIVWPDDNFGYVRHVASPAERRRSGGSGVYYHLSYLGAPLSYLWLATTPPALVWEEMHKAWEHGADRIWIVNVGDLKPAEISTEFFLQLAWNIERWRPETLDHFLSEHANREFGPALAAEIGAVWNDYYRLNSQRQPEHLQWWLRKEPHRPSPLTDVEVDARLADFDALCARVEALRERVPPLRRDAFYQLVQYPVVGSALANRRYFEGERGNRAAALAADARLTAETRYYNEELNGGKWRGILSLEPADAQWAGFRIERWSPPASGRGPVPAPAAGTFLARDAAQFSSATRHPGGAWTIVPGLGRTGRAVTVLPTTFEPVAPESARDSAPRLDYVLEFPARGEFTLHVHLLPTHPIRGTALRLAIALDDAPARMISLEIDDGSPDWAQGVLNHVRVVSTTLTVDRPGPHTLCLYGIETGVVVDKLVVDLGGMAPSYLGPPTPR